MVRPFPRIFGLLLVISFSATLANADFVPIAQLTYDANTATALAAFDITDLTGSNAVSPDFPITTQLTITVTSLVANLQGGGTLTISGSDFSVVDAQGDVNCTVAGDAASGGCDLSAYNLVSATLTGTLSPLTGLTGLPAGDSGIESAFTTTITPNAACGPNGGTATTLTAGCDGAVINATAVSGVTTPEPATWTLLGIGLIGLMAGYKFKRSGEVG